MTPLQPGGGPGRMASWSSGIFRLGGRAAERLGRLGSVGAGASGGGIGVRAAQRKGLVVLGFWSFRLSGVEVCGGGEEGFRKKLEDPVFLHVVRGFLGGYLAGLFSTP